MTPLLSICIPTYNRADLLAYCLENVRALDAFGIDYEIVIIDHASTDHTPQVIADAAARWGNVRSYRQAHQVGIERQIGAAYRMGRGRFTIYLADDDKLMVEALVRHVRFMEANPDVSAMYLPWLAYDDASEKVIHGYFEIPERTRFTAPQILTMIDFMTSRMIFPESGIYRSDALHALVMSRNNGPYQSFLLAQALVQHGTVVFDPEPYYLEVAVTKPQFARQARMNEEINLSYLDNIRGAMEIMIERAMLLAGHQKLPDNLRASVHEATLSYMHHRLIVAFRRAIEAKRYVQASELAQRIMLWRGIFQPDLIELANGIYVPTAVQAAAQMVGGKSWVKQVFITGFKQSDSLINALCADLPEVPIVAADAAAILAHPEPETIFVLVKSAREREPFLNGAISPAMVMALESFATYYQILPGKRNIDAL